MTIEAINPATGERIGRYQQLEESEVRRRIERAQEQFEFWRKTSFAERSQLLERVAVLLGQQRETFALLITSEMGKTLRESRAEIEKCAWACRYYAQHAEAFLQTEEVATDAARSLVVYEPLGVVLAVMPWNFPFWQVFRFAAPNVMAGNVGLLKHASNVPGCAEAIENIFRQAGFPDGVFTNLLIGSAQVGAVLEHPFVRAATLTGSDQAGRQVASKAGQQLKKTVLELGGSDAYLIFEDADLELAAEMCKSARLLNAGQSCIAGKRFIVLEEVYYSFMSLFLEKMRHAKMGNPQGDDTDLGPLARLDLREELHDQVQRSVELGARLELGGTIPTGEGAFYPPTVLSNVQPGMPAFDEELFGPVAAVILARDEAEAVYLANASEFGLGSAIFTRNMERAERLAKYELQAGSCFVNGMVKSDPRLPFGGIKASGFGRELSYHGIREFVNVKTVWMR